MGRIGLKFLLKTSEETVAFGEKIGAALPPNAIVALTGDLGAGKTTFVKGLALGLGINETVQSPTFVLLNIYQNLYHFDLYRLSGEKDFISLGFDEYFHKGGVCVFEWPERISSLLPKETIHISFSHEEKGRIAHVSHL